MSTSSGSSPATRRARCARLLSGRTAAARRAGLDGAGFTETIRRRYSARARRARDPRTPDLSRIYILELEAGVEPAQVKAALEADGAVEYAELDKVVKTQLLPNDPYLGSSGSWGQSYADLWGLHKIGAPAAWDATTGEGVLVAVVDTGLDVSHPDLAGNVWQNAGEVPGNLVDDDGNGSSA